MSAIAGSAGNALKVRVLLIRVSVALMVLAVVVVMVLAVRTLMKDHAPPKRQTTKIALLPDTPPPPPPKEEKKPEPKEEQKPQPMEQPKEITPPEPQQLKMEGPAGDAPSPFTGGEVKNDYIGGDVGTGDGLRFSAYADGIARQIQEDLSRRKLRGSSIRAYLWLAADGSVLRYKLGNSESRDSEADQKIQTAFAALTRVREPPPAQMPMPVGLQITVP